MIIYVGADHRGFNLKEEIKKLLTGEGYEVIDLGSRGEDPNDDYPKFAAAVAGQVNANFAGSRGILVCGSGVGMDIVANRFPQVRSALAFSPDQAMASRTDDDANVLSLPADYLDSDQAKKIVSVWLQAEFKNTERYRRRLAEIENLRVS